MADTFSSAEMRARDARVEARHQQQMEMRLSKKEAECQRLRRQLFEATNQLNNIVNILGFKGEEAVQETVFALEYYRDKNQVPTYEKLVAEWEEQKIWKDRLEGQTTDMTLLSQQLQREYEGRCEAQSRCDKLEADLQTSAVHIGDLQARYNAFVRIKKSADERYRRDYKKYHQYKLWLQDDKQQKIKNILPNDSKEVITSKELHLKRVQLQRSEFAKAGLSTISPFQDEQFLASIGTSSAEVETMSTYLKDKENMLPSSTLTSESLSVSASATTIFVPNTYPNRLSTPEKADVPVPHSSPNSPSLRPVPTFKVPELPSSPRSFRSRQSLSQHSSPATGRQSSPYASDTDNETQPLVFPTIFSPSSKAPGNTLSQSQSASVKISRTKDSVSSPEASPLPLKKRRITVSATVKVEDNDFGEALKTPPRAFISQPTAASTGKLNLKKRKRRDESPASNTIKTEPISEPRLKDKGKRRAKDAPTDYSAYKGRGRYGKPNQPESSTINSEFMINVSTNEGVSYAYNQVTRNKEERTRLQGGDCDECRAYYEAIGPLPSRLKAPLWRSPSKSQSQSDSPLVPSCDHHRERNKKAIASHQNAISKHRAQWARAKTPPGYWEIGFPDTQQVESMNQRAKVMHEEKRMEVRKEAGKSGGRWVKR
ncbi:DNA repair protein endonuclease SAE2/CtIP C-terminus-domain-containing protein [Flagelloscypha sp. PMI_526]|nr:DNA repair protein endonuclease SAE2/CtIP C-terminus-domain-containing protein [Flagelloscypha sp. PMI_526]